MNFFKKIKINKAHQQALALDEVFEGRKKIVEGRPEGQNTQDIVQGIRKSLSSMHAEKRLFNSLDRDGQEFFLELIRQSNARRTTG